LVDNNFVETVIALAPNLFYGTSIAVNIIVLSKHKSDPKTQFIDASGENFFKKVTNNNVLTDFEDEDNPGHIQQIVKLFDSKEDVEYIAKTIDNDKIAINDYNLSVSSYVTTKDSREQTDIRKLNTEIAITVKKINALRMNIDSLIKEIEA
jgi:type I restriction enzyme M protein